MEETKVEDIKYYIKTNNSYLSAYTIDIDNLLVDCINSIEGTLIENPHIYIYGKKAIQHRSIGFYSNTSIGYYYSRQLARSQTLTVPLQQLLDLINTKFDTDFNGILVNKYPDGNNYIGKHSDDEKSLSNIGVVSISYGATRKFRIRDKITNTIIRDIPTTSKEIWIMGGDFQKEFTHEIPIEKKVKEYRYSFTFRKHLY
jgi:alkylated DNA repair dioxygenase AlkB